MTAPPESVERCKLCGSVDTYVYMQGIHDCEDTKVIECCDCDVQFLSPMMSDDAEQLYYKNYYAQQRDRHGGEVTLQNILDKSFEYYSEYLDTYEKYISNSNNILEIGSGVGGFLKFLSKTSRSKKRVVSIERSESNLAFLKERFADVSFFSDIKEVLNKEMFDMILGVAVFEHIRKPLEFLGVLERYLKPNGIIMLEMPNKREPLIELYQIDEFKKFNYQKQHYFTYSERALEWLAGKAGLTVEGFYYHQVYGLENHISWLKNRRPCDYSMFTSFFSRETLRNYKSDLIRAKRTDVIGVIYKNA